jgi:TfoX/Sxy family transcriptional regulator of competence genes
MPARKQAPPAKKRPARKMPAFTKPSAETVAAFLQATQRVDGAEPRTMFGYPSVFLNGNMLACVFQDRIMVRLSERDRADATKKVGAKPFEPSPGRPMREYVELPRELANDPKKLRRWLDRGVAYVGELPAKTSKAAGTKKKKKKKKSAAPVVADPQERVRRLARALPDVEEGTTFGYPAFKSGGKAFAWFPKKKEVEDGSLGVRMSFDERDHRVRTKPAVYYFTPHYKDYTSVLARVWLMTDAELRELLESGYEFVRTTR